MDGCLIGCSGFYYGVLIALANASGNVRGHEFVTVVVANDRNIATTQALTHRAIRGNGTYLGAIDEVVSLVSLNSRQAVLFD